ncbi:MAG: sigma-70 family RNA polymerase sigma factor [Phycisphaerales bacterium]|jgi:RNA polymerase sigma-70 factor (ECF subfamily)|nr:sigma-70 family RNA polymerase sigma factor [Phycisphaerales bacterium]
MSRPSINNREVQRHIGNGKNLNPDRLAPSHAAPGAHAQVKDQSPVDHRTDEQLLAAYRQGDRAGFTRLVERYQRELYLFLVRFLGNRAAAEDIFQEAFLQVHQSADSFDLDRRFRPWLFTIAANKARDLMRAQSRRPANPLQAAINPGDDESGQFIDLMESASNLPGEPLEKRELQQMVQKTVMEMPEHLREIIILSYFHQFPYKQISDILGIPLGTVKSRLHSAVAHFADRWKSANPPRSPS